MPEYIERIAAIRTACKGCNKEFPNEPCEPAECYIQQGLFRTQAADVVEVVRCKDCKHYKPQNKSKRWHGTKKYCCRVSVIKVSDNDFCSFGAKMDGKGENDG